jgi:peptidoglycan/LPS O-acetylase OafA/YrhL
MGILRVLLAIFVVCAHITPRDSGPGAWISGGAIFAVKTFFIISGFYMALVLEGNYRRRPVRDFYASRALRILPVYWFVSVIALVVELLIVPRGQFLHPLASPFAYTMGIQFRTLPWPILLYIGV